MWIVIRIMWIVIRITMWIVIRTASHQNLIDYSLGHAHPSNKFHKNPFITS